MLVASGVKPTAADTPPASPSAAPPSAKTSAVAPGLPVYVRFIQISNRSRSAQDRVMEPINTGLANSINNQDGGTLGAEASSGPMHGYLIAQAPLSGLRFEQDAGNYSAHAVITQIVRNADGKIVWHADKDVKIGGPLAKLKERQAGNLYLMRDVLLPGGQFTLEASVQDLLAKKTSNISEPLKTGASVPGLRISDAMFVKAYHGNVDRFEADMVFNYEGYAIAPMLGPVFPANTPFKVELYFIIYPDVSGPPIGITLEILQGGKVVASASMPFKSALRNNIESQKGSAVSSERVHGFDYLASLDVAKMSASDCQARLTVRQGKNVVTRLVDFTVAGTTAMAQKSTDAKTAN
jgi:hypothetical protein